MESTSQNMDFDNYDGQELHFCTLTYPLSGCLVTDDYCRTFCKKDTQEEIDKCMWRRPASDYVIRRERLERRR